jgi:hypothetical protein
MQTKETDGESVYVQSRVTKVMHMTYDVSSGRDIIRAIYVFCGSEYAAPPPPPPNPDSVESNTAYFEFIKKTGFFSETELKNIQALQSKRKVVVFINDRINLDDTIQEIKRKIVKYTTESSEDDLPLTSHTLYLFGQFASDVTTQEAYNQMSRNGRDAITEPILLNYISNIAGAGMELGNSVGKNHIYSYSDIKELRIENIKQRASNPESGMTCMVSSPLGHAFQDGGAPYIFAANPFTNAPSIPGISDKTLKDDTGRMLMEYGLPVYNTIYMCSYDDVVSVVKEMVEKRTYSDSSDDESGGSSSSSSSNSSSDNDDVDDVAISNALLRAKQIYFPFLKRFEYSGAYLHDVPDSNLVDQLDEMRSNERNPDSAENVASKHVNFFYDVYDNRLKSIANPSGAAASFTYLDKGIAFLRTIFKPVTMDRKFPVDAVFKTLCSSEAIPFIKMRYSGEAGNGVFKLHAPHVNKYGNRVPAISLGDFNKINRMCKSRQRIDCVSLYIGAAASAIHKNVKYVIIEFDSNSNIMLTAEMNEDAPCSVSQLNTVISRLLNPILYQLNILFEQSGFVIPNFETLYDTDHVKLVNMRYDFKVAHSNKLELKTMAKCGDVVFRPEKQVVTNGGKTTTAFYDFKRVSNYGKVISAAATTAAAAAVASGKVNHAEAKTNGLKLAFQSGIDNIDKATGKPYTLIAVGGITCIHMLSTVPVYIDALLRIFHKEMTNIPEETIQDMCFTGAPAAATAAPTAAPSAAAATAGVSAAEESDAEVSPVSDDSDFDRMMNDVGREDEFSEYSGGAPAGRDKDKDKGKGKGKKGAALKQRNRSRSRSRSRSKGRGSKSDADSDADSDSGSDSKSGTPGQGSRNILSILQETDPGLFSLQPQAGTKSYARCCTRRSKSNKDKNQPIALTDKEMEVYEQVSGIMTQENERLYPHTYKNGSGSGKVIDWDKTSFWRYSERKGGKLIVHAIRFGSTRGNMRWYICPRYWDTRDGGKVITDDEVERLKMRDKGRGLPPYIEEFSVDGNYTPLFPGLVGQDDGRKMPCCFTQSLNLLRLSVKERDQIDFQKKRAAQDLAVLKERYVQEVKRVKEENAKRGKKEKPLPIPDPPPALEFPEWGIGVIPQWRSRILKTGIIPPLDELQAEIEQEARASEMAEIAAPVAADAAAQDANAANAFGNRILKADTKKLGSMQLGHLPVPLQRFFNTNDTMCDNLKTGCLLRYGVEHSHKQSFIGAVACAYNPNAASAPPSIAKMRKQIADSISLDSFVSYNNSTLVTQFVSDADDNVDDATVDAWLANSVPEDVKASAIFEKLSASAESETVTETASEKRALLYHLCMALGRFKSMFSDNKTVLDHALLWEVITSPNPALFKRGINLVILDIPENDDTHNVNILCPPNRYAEQVFDHRKSTMFLCKRNENGFSFYEPICLYGQKMDGGKTVQFLFNLHANTQAVSHPAMFDNVKRAITYTRNLQTVMCPPVISRMNFIKGPGGQEPGFRPNFHAKRVERTLLQTGFKITAQVLNYDNRVIGLIVERDDGEFGSGYIPTESSEMIINDDDAASAVAAQGYGVGYGPKYEIKYTDDESIEWMPYEVARAFLNYVHSQTGLPCRPVANVTDDSTDAPMIIGVLTETNQFVHIYPTEPVNRLPNGEVLDATTPSATARAIGVKDNHYAVDKAVLLDRGYVTSGRADVVKAIELETNFYNAFRVTARHLLNKATQPFPMDVDNANDAASASAVDSSATISKQIHDVVFETDAKTKAPYAERLNKVESLLRKLMQHSVTFVDYDTSALLRIESCIKMDSCNPESANSRSYCARDDEMRTGVGQCRLRIPEHRLMFRGANAAQSSARMEPLFYARLADELIRYPRMRDFMFTARPNDYYIASRIPQVVCENELILTQSVIDGTDAQSGYFANEENQPDAEYRANGPVPGVNRSVFNLKRKKVVKRHAHGVVSDARLEQKVQAHKDLVKMSVPRGVEMCLAPVATGTGSKRYTMDVFQGAFPGDVADARIIKNGDITFALMSNLLHIHGKLNADENVAAMKQKLIETYTGLGPERVNRVCNVWSQSGPQMQRLAQDVMGGKVTLEFAVKSSVYTLTPFDIWILASEYEVPVILFSSSPQQQQQQQQQQQPQQQLVSRFFCNGCSNGVDASTNARVLYSDGKADTRYHVIVCTQPMNSFPVYGIVQHSSPDNARVPPVTRYSIEQKDLMFSQPIASLYAKNQTVFDFIDKNTPATAATVTAVAAPAAKPVVAVAATKPTSAANIMKSLPLIEMKKTGELPGTASEAIGDDVEVHDPEIRRLLTHGKEQLESSIHRLESPGIDPGVQSDAAKAKDNLDHLNI